jgi:hypothetical protein
MKNQNHPEWRVIAARSKRVAVLFPRIKVAAWGVAVACAACVLLVPTHHVALGVATAMSAAVALISRKFEGVLHDFKDDFSPELRREDLAESERAASKPK